MKIDKERLKDFVDVACNWCVLYSGNKDEDSEILENREALIDLIDRQPSGAGIACPFCGEDEFDKEGGLKNHPLVSRRGNETV